MKDTTAPSPPKSAIRSTALVLGLVASATLIGLLLEPHLSLTSQAMLYVLAVVIASYSLHRLASILCALGAVTALNFFFVPPRWTLVVEGQENLIALGTLLAVALVISHLVAQLRQESGRSRLTAWRAFQLQKMATQLVAAASPKEVHALGRNALNAAFSGPSLVTVLPHGSGTLPLEPWSPAVRDALDCCIRERAVIGPGTGRWPGLNAWYLPLGDLDRTHGAACIHNVQAADNEGRDHAYALCVLLAQTLHRLQLSNTVERARSEADRQQIQSTLLAAISHDLRTPLAAIMGAASALDTQGTKLDPVERQRLLTSLVNEASYLSELTENTLQLVRLANTEQVLHRDWESMEEIVGAVLGRLRQRDPTRRIRARVPEGLPLLKADPVLLAQLLSNLLDNALKYSTEAIDLVITLHASSVQLAVKDRGVGIDASAQETIFQPYSRNDRSGQRGAGLGLALCRAIAQAHGGTLCVRRRTGGGSSFVLTLPLESHQPGAQV